MASQSSGTDNAMGVVENETLKKLVNDYIDGTDSSEDLESRQKDIFSKFQLVYVKNPLLHIVDALSFALTDINVEKRAKGTGLLAECIHQYVPGSMDGLEVETLMKFFCDRLKDHHSIQPIVVYAFLGLISFQNINSEQIVIMLQSIFAEIHVQSLVQADRRNIFNIFSNLLKTKTHVLKPFSSEFIFGFIQAMDCERDPRNLLICFENAYVVIKELDFGLFAEDLFEVLSCYFPVEFREPKEDKFRIKKEDLVDALRICLTAEKAFAQYAIPLYLEKLSSDIIESKLDSLITFTECLKIYNPEDVAVYVDDIWLGIRKDYLLSDYKELSKPYLDFVFNLIKCLSRLDDNNEPLLKIIDFLIKDCLQTLKDPEMIIAIPCSNIILCASNASGYVFEEILKKLILPIQEGLQKYTSIQQRTNLFEIVTKILTVNNTDIVVPNSSLVNFVDYLIPLLYTLLADGESITLQVLSLRCLKNIILKSLWFEHCNFDILAQHCFCPVQEKVLSSQLLFEYKSFVEIISEKFPLIFKKQYLEVLQTKVIGRVDKKISSQCLVLLEYTSFKNEELVNTLYSYFQTFITNINLKDCEDVLRSYINILKKSKITIEGTLFIIPVIDFMKSMDLSVDMLLKISQLLSESFNLLNVTQRKELFMFVYTMLSNQYRISESLFGTSITLHLDNNLLYFSILLRGIFTQLNSHDLHDIDVDIVCKGIMNTMEKVDCFETLRHLGIVFGTIMNKLPTDSPLTKKYLDLISHLINTDKQCNYAIILLSCITKGLVLNWQTSTTIAIDLMLSSLNYESVANVTASGFDVIVKDVDGAFTKRSCAIIKLMYKQRYTQYVLPLLIQRYYDGRDEVKSFHMIAISNTLPAIPKQLLQKHLKSMMPLLMHSLVTCKTTPIIESTLSTISSVLTENKEIIMEYVPSLVTSLLNHMTHNHMNIRILSLKSLAILSSYTTHVIQPMKSEVVRKVRPVLDDKKRLVRKEAILCSNSWHLMTPGEKE